MRTKSRITNPDPEPADAGSSPLAAVRDALRSALPHLMDNAERVCVVAYDDFHSLRSLFTTSGLVYAEDLSGPPDPQILRLRFEDKDFSNGTLFGHHTMKDAVLFEAAAQAAGLRTVLLLGIEHHIDDQPFLVLTSLQCDCETSPEEAPVRP